MVMSVCVCGGRSGAGLGVRVGCSVGGGAVGSAWGWVYLVDGICI